MELDEVKVISRQVHKSSFHFVWVPELVANNACRKLNQFSVFALYQHKAPFNWLPPAHTLLLPVEGKWSEDISMAAYHGFASCSFAYISNFIYTTVPANCVRLCVIHFLNPQQSSEPPQQDAKQDEKKGNQNILSAAQVVVEIKKAVVEAHALVGERKIEDDLSHQKSCLEACVSRLMQEIPADLSADVHSEIEKFWRDKQFTKDISGASDVSDSHNLARLADYKKWYSDLNELKEDKHFCHDSSPEKYRIDCSHVCRSMYKLGCYVVSVNDGMQHHWPASHQPSDQVLEDVVEEHLLIRQTHRMRDPRKDISSKYPLLPNQPINHLEYSARAAISVIVPIPVARKLIPELWHKSGLMCYYHVIGDAQDPPAIIDLTYHTQCKAPYFVRIGFLLHFLHAFYASFPSAKYDQVFRKLLQSTHSKTLCEINIIDSVHGRPLSEHLLPSLVDALRKKDNK